MTSGLFHEIEMVTNTLSELTYRLTESFYEDNQIFLAQQRIAKLRANIDRERQRITQLRTVLHRRREQERNRKQTQKTSSNGEDES
jgi:predicted RNase H-like nuclease (RuvC/YqgF family)